MYATIMSCLYFKIHSYVYFPKNDAKMLGDLIVSKILVFNVNLRFCKLMRYTCTICTMWLSSRLD